MIGRSAPHAALTRARQCTADAPFPSCGHMLTKKGSWFKTIGHYRCEGCLEDIPLSYEAKVQLFDDHANLKSPPARTVRRRRKIGRRIKLPTSAS
jgi:hypothetical protein